MNRITPVTTILAALAGLTLSQQVAAVTQQRAQVQTGASMCQLSIPTTDTKVRPKAIGFRNEGTTNAFTICALASPPGGQGFGSTDYGLVAILLKSMDGNDHVVTCTGVNSVADGDELGFPQPQYVTKTVTVNDSDPLTGVFGVQMQWKPEDFGATPDTTIPYSSAFFSVTCNLPPNVSIKYGGGTTTEDVGN